ncbi:hypothetical protein IMG5_076830, partial [Ichthyophthirius multifiliis]
NTCEQQLSKQDFAEEDEEIQQRIISSQDINTAIYKENFKNINNLNTIIKIRKLNKKFGEITAINNLSLTLFEKQIFCLLGHNGAGKSTIISILTGLISKNNGKIIICDMYLDKDIDKIRQSFGVCLQKDVLYDQLTVEEHLQFIGQIKGCSLQQIQQETEELIMKCQLNNERGKQSSILSGGNKRKLSLAMSLIGGSKIIFLDEPSSGLDYNARQEICHILLQMKSLQKTIVLTTHHLEEAEEVADRIGIMFKGQLLALGTNDFIKNKFGTGYYLTVMEKNENKKLTVQQCDNIKQIVTNNVKTAIFNSQSQNGTVQFTLPFEEQDVYTVLFKLIEQNQNYQLILKMNTLEDAFINIESEDKKKNLKNNQNNQNKQEKFTDFSYILTPECLYKPPLFDFINQTYACFLRKFYITMRTLALFSSFLFPLVLQIIGILICTKAITQNKHDNKQQIHEKSILRLILNGVCQILAFAFNTSSYSGLPVMERELKLKYVLSVMGCRSYTYWLRTLIFDIIFATFGIVLFIIFCFVLQFEEIINNIGQTFGLLYFFIFTLITYSYLISFVFKKEETCYKVNIYIIKLIQIQTQIQIYIYIYIYLYIYIYIYYLFIQILILYIYINKDYIWPSQINYTYLIFTAQFIVFSIFTIYLDYKYFKLIPDQQINNNNLQINNNIPEEVIKEQIRVSNKNCLDKIKVQNLYKIYNINSKPFTAIQNNSFGVQNGEILGLLGPNGAGKSTTFNILTSFINKSQGSVKLKSIEVQNGIMDIYQDVGICPQFDAIYENLTVLEHLKLFGRMKGLKGKDLDASINYFLKVIQLEDYTHRQACKLSGGNKRKLCVAIALIGGPDMQFFDEPSTGVDPISKRFLWNTLSQSLKLRNGAIVITTHSMQEAEFLCTKIGILINGKFMCYGSPQFLKNKYGKGYQVSFECSNINQIQQIILQQYPNAKLQTTNNQNDQNNYKTTFLFPYQGFCLSEIFNFFYNDMQQNRKLISNFQVDQCSLAQIFVDFSQLQKVNNFAQQ